MPKQRKDERRLERVLVLFSRAEFKRLNAYCAANTTVGRSEYLRGLILEEVGKWELGQADPA